MKGKKMPTSVKELSKSVADLRQERDDFEYKYVQYKNYYSSHMSDILKKQTRIAELETTVEKHRLASDSMVSTINKLQVALSDSRDEREFAEREIIKLKKVVDCLREAALQALQATK